MLIPPSTSYTSTIHLQGKNKRVVIHIFEIKKSPLHLGGAVLSQSLQKSRYYTTHSPLTLRIKRCVQHWVLSVRVSCQIVNRDMGVYTIYSVMLCAVVLVFWGFVKDLFQKIGDILALPYSI